MPGYAPPPGQVPAGSRLGTNPGELQYVNQPTPPLQPSPPPLHPGPQVPGQTRQDVTWRQVVVYAGTISVDGTEIPLLNPPMGCKVMRVGFRVRTTMDVDDSSYWTLWVSAYDVAGNIVDIDFISTDDTSLRAGEGYNLVDADHELRGEADHELVVRFVKTGSPSDLTQVALYCDYYPGV